MLLPQLLGARATAVFCADLIPGVPWVHLPVTMGYDRFPEQLIDEKAELFSELEARQSFLLFTHDPDVSAAQVERDDRGRYRPVAAQAKLVGWDLDRHEAPTA